MRRQAFASSRHAGVLRLSLALVLAAIAVLALVAVTPASAEATCSATDDKCNACDGSGKSEVNFMNGLPRFNRKGKGVSANIAKYTVFVCKEGTGGAGQPACEAELSPALREVSGDDFQSAPYTDDASSPLNYAEGVSLYVVVAVVLLLVSLVFSCLFMFFRYCCFCCNKCTGGCGSRFPTPNTKKGCCQCGFDPVANRYSGKSKALARVCMLTFVALVAAGVTMGFIGASGLKGTLQRASTAPDPAADLVFDLLPRLQHTYAHLVGGPIVGTVSAVRTAVLDAVDLTRAKNDLVCTRNVLASAPDGQPILDFVDSLDVMLASLPSYARATAALQSLNYTVTVLPAHMAAVEGTLRAYDSALQPLRTTTIADDLRALNTSINLLRPFPGVVVRDFEKIDAHAPKPATLADLVVRVDQLTTDGAGYEGLGFRQTLKADLEQLRTNITLLPNVTDFANMLVDMNSTIDVVDVTVGQLADALQGIETALASLPQQGLLVGQLEAVHALIKGINLDEILDMLKRINTTISLVPDVSLLIPELNRIQVVRDAVPCVLSMVAQVRSINASLVRLPSGMDSMIDQAGDINSTISDALKEVEELEQHLHDVDETLDSLPDMSETYEDVLRMRKEMNKLDSELNITSLILSVRSADKDTNITFGSVLERTNNIRDILRDPDTRPTQQMISTLRSMDEELGKLPSMVTHGISGITRWERGWCADDTAISCLCDNLQPCFDTTPYRGPSAHCPSNGMCEMAAAARSTGVCKDDVTTPCTTDDDCAAGDECRVPDLGPLSSTMTDLSSDLTDLPDSSEIVGNMRDAQTNIDALPNLDEKVEEVQVMEGSIHALPNITDYVVQLQEVVARLDDVPNTGDLLKDWKELNQTLEDLPDLDGARDAVRSFRDMVDDVLDGPLEDAVDYAGRAETFFHHNLTTFLARLAPVQLLATMEAGGLAAGVEAVLRVAEESYDVMLHKNAKLTGPDGPLHSALEPLRRAQDAEARARGSLYYFLRLANMSMPNSTSDGDQVTKNAAGDEWKELFPHADVQMCLTERCIRNTLDELFDNSMEDNSDGAVPVSVPTYLVLMLPYILPILVALLGLLGMVCVKCQRINPAICVTCCSFLMMPFIFLIVGVLLFPFVMVLSDACASGEAVGRQYVTLAWPTICSGSLKGVMVPGTEDCRLEVAGANITVSPAMYDELLLGTCPETGSLAGVLSAFADEFKAQPHERVSEQLQDLRDGDFFLRPALENPILQGAEGLGPFVQYLAGNVSATLSCGGLHGVYAAFKSPLCCDAMTNVFWAVSSWYLIGLAMLFCGCCAGILGNKRFPTRPWGKHAVAVRSSHAQIAGKEPAGDDDIPEETPGAALALHAHPGQPIPAVHSPHAAQAQPAPAYVQPGYPPQPAFAPPYPSHNPYAAVQQTRGRGAAYEQPGDRRLSARPKTQELRTF